AGTVKKLSLELFYKHSFKIPQPTAKEIPHSITNGLRERSRSPTRTTSGPSVRTFGSLHATSVQSMHSPTRETCWKILYDDMKYGDELAIAVMKAMDNDEKKDLATIPPPSREAFVKSIIREKLA
ncbi:hypothetical protein A2U01_0011978, partial [Trifolium medium]|nr:hypothetical protein [Trifolium medium]